MIIDISDIRSAASCLVELSRTCPSNTEQHRAGGYLFLGTDGLRQTNLIQVGRFTETAKLEKYERLAQEKAFRTYAHWLRDPINVVSSWQTLDEDQGMYGGAVLFPVPNEKPTVISFSGLIALTDEAVSTVMGVHLHIATPEQILRIQSVSRNQVISELETKYRAAA